MDGSLPTRLLAEACRSAGPSEGHHALLAAVARAVPGRAFEVALVREGWHRAGGVLAADGQRISDNLRDWAEAESGGDIVSLAARHGSAGLLATRIAGKTLYLTAPTGDGAMDFIQVVVEELQEVLDRPLFDPDVIVDDIEELVDPLDCVRLKPKPVGQSQYVLRRATAFSDAVLDAGSAYGNDPRFRRFVADWSASSAGLHGHFSANWILTLLPYVDRFGRERFDVKPRSTHAVNGCAVAPDTVRRGAEMAGFLHAFDRSVGYAMAWYFAMVTRSGVPPEVAYAIHDDLMGAYAYLPQRDLAILKAWIRDPYRL